MKPFLTALMAAGLCFAHTFTQAQQPGIKISGRVLEPDNQPAIAATISLLKVKDSAAVMSTLTDVNGKFVLDKLSAGGFMISVSAIGFNKYYTAPLQLTEKSKDISIPAITLRQSSTALKSVSIIAQTPMVEQRLDRMVVNVSAFISNTGATALEALEKVPGLTVDGDGAISFRGKTGVMVLIDNKPTYLSGSNLANYLRSLPASQLDKIELMSNPPARYDASGSSGVINIRTKRVNQKGFNGTFNAAFGRAAYWRNSESLAFNYRVNKLNFFINTGYSVGKSYRRLDVERQYFDASDALRSSYTEEAYFNGLSNNPNLRTGFDYFLSPKNTLGVIITAGLSSGNTNNPITSTIKDGMGVPDSIILSDNNTKSKFKNGGINLNYTHQIDSLGRNISFDADYLRYDNVQDQDFQNTTYNAAGTTSLLQNITANLPTKVNIYAVKSDYIHPLGHKAELSAGVKASFVNTDNSANYFNVNNGASTVDLNNTNHFIYRENIQAAYISFNKELNRFAFQGGLRAEHTDVNGHQLGNSRSKDSIVVQNYLDVFPTAYLSYKIDSAGHHQLIASYGRRINRPYYQDLNPFVFILDKYSTFQGNPFLRPQYSGNYQLSYNYKSMLTFTLAYTRITGFKVENDYQQGNIFVGSSVNLEHASGRTASVNLSLRPLNHWNMNTYLEVTNSRYSGQLTTSYLNVSQTFFASTMNNQFTLGKGWSAELSGSYIGERTYGQFIQAPRWQLTSALQKKIIHNKAAIKLTAQDIFRHDLAAGEITNLPGVMAHYSNDYATRSVTVGFNYNFGSTIKNQRKHDSTGADDEASRVKN